VLPAEGRLAVLACDVSHPSGHSTEASAYPLRRV